MKVYLAFQHARLPRLAASPCTESGLCARQEARPAEAEDAFQRAEALVTRWGAAQAREVALRAHMYQCMGEHAKAVALVSRALEAGLGPAPIECLFLRGARVLPCTWRCTPCALVECGLGSMAPYVRRHRACPSVAAV